MTSFSTPLADIVSQNYIPDTMNIDMEVKPTFLIGWFKNHFFLSRDLLSSEMSHHF